MDLNIDGIIQTKNNLRSVGYLNCELGFGGKKSSFLKVVGEDTASWKCNQTIWIISMNYIGTVELSHFYGGWNIHWSDLNEYCFFLHMKLLGSGKLSDY